MDVISFNDPLFSTLQQLMDIPEEIEKAFNAPTRAYVRDRKAMARTPADIKEFPSAYVFEVDMPGIRGSDIKVQVEEGNLLVVSGERRRPEEVAAAEGKEKETKEGETKEEGKEEETSKPRYLRMERRMGKFMRRFPLPENANTEAVSATCKDGVLTVTVEKVPPPEPKKPKTIKVEVA